ncbi:MAG: mechanosensitive ion channel family protein [Nitrososphaerales archaeon]
MGPRRPRRPPAQALEAWRHAVMVDLFSSLSRVTVVAIVRLAIIAIVAWAGFRAIELGRRVFDRRVVQKADDGSRRARLATMLEAAVRTLQLLLLFVVVLMALGAVGINIGPVVAAAGVVGLAVSLGAQALIKDFIGGILILLEDQFRVGDVIRVQDAEGTVERISLRASNVRDAQGRLWVVPNGDVRFVSNATRDWARAVVDLNLELGADVNKAVAVLQAAMDRAALEPVLQDKLLESPVAEGYVGITDWAVQVRLKAMTQPGQQWLVARLLREWGLAALREAGVPLASRLASPPFDRDPEK